MQWRIRLVLNEDGTGSYVNETWDRSTYTFSTTAEATFSWSVEDNGDGTYSVTIANVTGSTELVAGTYTAQNMTNNYGETAMNLVNVSAASMTLTLAFYE